MRHLLLCLSIISMLPFSGCETAWGGSEKSAMSNLQAKETAKIDQEAASGEISSEEASEQKQSFSQATKANESINKEAERATPNPAGETRVNPYTN